MKSLELSTGELCPRCGCESLEKADTGKTALQFDVHYVCVAGCGMQFGLNMAKNHKVTIGYDEENEPYLMKRFNMKKLKP